MAQILTFTGEYDMPCKDALRKDMNAAADQDVVILDFTGVTYIDSTCLTELALLTRNRQEAHREPPILVLPDGAVKRIVCLMHIDVLFRIFPTLDEALAERRESFERRSAKPGGPYFDIDVEY
jgi:anti-anti-sigma factor